MIPEIIWVCWIGAVPHDSAKGAQEGVPAIEPRLLTASPFCSVGFGNIITETISVIYFNLFCFFRRKTWCGDEWGGWRPDVIHYCGHDGRFNSTGT